MLRGCAEITGVEVENYDMGSPRGSGVPASFADGTVQEVIHRVELRSAKNVEASNAAIAAHMGALAERLGRVEKEQDSSLQRQIGRAPPGEDKKGAQETEYCNYTEFIATTQTNLNCVGVHTWSLCAATRRTAGRGVACAALLPSAALLTLQCFVLLAVGLNALHPTCVRNEDCRAGMWCAPSLSPEGYSRSPGMCDDCGWASKLNEQDYPNLPSRYNEDAYAALTKSDLPASETLATAVLHCDASDAEPERCDFVISFRSQLTLGPLLVLVFVTSIFLMSLVADMDKQAQASEVFAHRHAHKPAGGRSCLVASGARMLFTLRRFVLPGVAAYAYATLVLTGPNTQGRSLPISFVLAGLVVGFVYNVDRLLALTLLGENAQAGVREAFADVEAQKGPLSVPLVSCFLHRIFAGCLGCLIMAEMLATETMMDAVPFRLDWDAMPARWLSNPSPMSCTNVVAMLGTTTVVMVVFFTLVWSIALHAKKSALDTVVSPLLALLAMPVLSYIVLRVGYSPVP